MANLTKNAIMETFSALLETTPFDKVTVLMITRKCGVSPNTFYYHFRDIYDLLSAWLERALDRYEPASGMDWRESVRSLLRDCRANRQIMRHLFCPTARSKLERCVSRQAESFFYRFVRGTAEGGDLPEAKLQALAALCRYTFLGYLFQYLGNDMEENIDEIVAALDYLFTDVVLPSAGKREEAGGFRGG